MERKFTKFTGSILMLVLLLVGFNVKAQTTLASNEKLEKKAVKKDSAATTLTQAKTTAKPAEDTTWKPQRRLWGYTFGDFYYNAHADATNRGPESMYNGVPQYRNAFQFRRLYLGYDYEITKKFKAEVLLASEPNANTGVVTATSTSVTTVTPAVPGSTTTTKTTTTTTTSNGDNLVDGKMAFWIKNFNLRVRDVWNGTDFVIGEMGTPGFALNEPGTNGPNSLSESTWAYRSIEKTITDVHKNNSYDLGAALQGTFDPATKNYGYVFMVGNNSQASLLSAGNANTGFFKIFYGDIWAKFLNQKLYVDIYADYLKTSGNSTATNAVITGGVPVGTQYHNMFKIFASYTTKPVTIGVEAYTQKLQNSVINSGVVNPTAGAPVLASAVNVEDATVHGLSVWVRGPIVKTLNYFARFDTYNPDTKFNKDNNYPVVLTNYGSFSPAYKETFYTAGLDYNPVKNVHFEPNFWLINYQDQKNTTVASRVVDDHNLVFRFTFFYTFGK
ncbi:MAG TPA: hypothetical protein VK671_05025 [Mucilaginibacter sp.]|nr:hypothetical protein [Mucilaginibacter sp.]